MQAAAAKRRSKVIVSEPIEQPEPIDKPKRRSKAIEAFLDDRDQAAMLTAKRIISSYGGVKALQELLGMSEKQATGPEIAKRFDVTRQRVSQWRMALGNDFCVFSLRPCVADVIKHPEKLVD